MAFDGPRAPVAPEVIVRDGARVTLRAVRVSTPLRIDGQLDEAVYSSVQAMSDLISTATIFMFRRASGHHARRIS